MRSAFTEAAQKSFMQPYANFSVRSSSIVQSLRGARAPLTAERKSSLDRSFGSVHRRSSEQRGQIAERTSNPAPDV